MLYTCEFCNHQFKTPSNLKTHKATAKFCLKNRPNDATIVLDTFSCKYCDKNFSQKRHLQTHLDTCKMYLISIENKKITQKFETELATKDVQIKKKDIKNTKLKSELEKEKDTVLELELIVEKANERIRELEIELARNEGQIVGMEKGRVTNNTINNYINPKLANISTDGLPYLTKGYIKEFVDNDYFTYEDFLLGPCGIAKFLGDCVTINDQDEDAPPRKNYLCTDSSRHKYHKYENTGWKLDVDAKFLGTVFNEIRDKANDYYQTLTDKCNDETDIINKEILDNTRVNLITPMMIGINSKKGAKREKLISDVRLHLKPLVSI